jgi:hypothetical protein
MKFICCAVVSEGGTESSNLFGYDFIQKSDAISVGTGGTHVLSIRPKTTFNSITNRIKVILTGIELFNSGNQPVYWELCLGQAISGTTTFNDINTTYSSMQYNFLGTLSGSPTIVIDGGWLPASGSSKVSVGESINSRYPITLDAAGAVRSLGTVTIKMTSLSGSQTCYGALKFKEIR